MSKLLEKVKKHAKDCPQYSFLDEEGKYSEERFAKFEKADDLLEGKLQEIHEWYVELKKILGIPKKEKE